VQAVINAFYIYTGELIEICFNGAFSRSDVTDTGIVDEYVDGTLRTDVIDDLFYLLLFGDIALVISPATPVAPFSSISNICTVAPCCANAMAIAFPMPLPPPVMIAVLLSRRNMVLVY
jgi:hypothetical protein